jgi:hypothetical protein
MKLQMPTTGMSERQQNESEAGEKEMRMSRSHGSEAAEEGQPEGNRVGGISGSSRKERKRGWPSP